MDARQVTNIHGCKEDRKLTYMDVKDTNIHGCKEFRKLTYMDVRKIGN